MMIDMKTILTKYLIPTTILANFVSCIIFKSTEKDVFQSNSKLFTNILSLGAISGSIFLLYKEFYGDFLKIIGADKANPAAVASAGIIGAICLYISPSDELWTGNRSGARNNVSSNHDRYGNSYNITSNRSA